MTRPECFRAIFVGSNIWQGVWLGKHHLSGGSVRGVEQELYEAATIDGASKWKQTLHVTIPGILPTIVIMFILRMGSLLSVGYEKIILLYNPLTYDTADVISSYVYRRGLLDTDYSFSTAVGTFKFCG